MEAHGFIRDMLDVKVLILFVASRQMLVANQHQHTNLANITVDQAIRDNIHMDVVIEEDPDEPQE